jgi:hypothetical protein
MKRETDTKTWWFEPKTEISGSAMLSRKFAPFERDGLERPKYTWSHLKPRGNRYCGRVAEAHALHASSYVISSSVISSLEKNL